MKRPEITDDKYENPNIFHRDDILWDDYLKDIGSYCDYLEDKINSSLPCVSERFMLIEQAATYLDSLPSSQAIQQIKSLLTMKPATSVIDGDVILVMRNER